jgi:DNA-binding transcriptional ArsR family regulator
LLVRGGVSRPVRLDEVEQVLASGDLVVDACRRAVRGPVRSISLARRPVLFALARALAEAWPADVARDDLTTRAFETRVVNESHRARLRVELGRLRTAVGALARVEATKRGFALVPARAAAVVVLAPPIDGPAGAILALLESGESWSTSAIAQALGSSQRTVQRALRDLEEAATVRSIGRGRAQRWLAPPVGGIATTLLLPGALPVG